MKRKFFAIICIIYSLIIFYVWISKTINNYLVPNIQFYLKISSILLLIMGIVMLYSNKINCVFKISDLILLIPLILLIASGDGMLSLTLANNRVTSYGIESEEDYVEDIIIDEVSVKTIEIDDIYFDVNDQNYDSLGNYFQSYNRAKSYIGKTIRVKGFTVIQDDYFTIGKYDVSCCTADASYLGFISKYDLSKIKNNTWYEIEGIFERGKSSSGKSIIYINVININEIDSKNEDLYVYPCYYYDDDGSCKEAMKYNLEE